MSYHPTAGSRAGAPPENAAAVFDQWAGAYDEAFTQHRTGMWLRESVRRLIRPFLREHSRVLELGCGTGEDAAWLAAEGHLVLATDASAAMLDIARQKAAAGALNIDFEQLDLNRCSGLPVAGHRSFDLVFANFGVLNCVRDPDSLFSMCRRSMAPGAVLCAVVMGRVCAWESLWFGLRGRVREATRRWRGQALVRANDAAFTVHYYSPGRLKSAAAPGFLPRGLAPIGVFLPPSYLFAYQDRWPRFFRTLQALEQFAQRFRAPAYIADHYLLVLMRRPG